MQSNIVELDRLKEKAKLHNTRNEMLVAKYENDIKFVRIHKRLKEAKFDKLGAFTYSKEDGTPAEKLPNQIHGNTKKARYNKITYGQDQVLHYIICLI